MALNQKTRAVLREMRNTVSPKQVQIYMSLGDTFNLPWAFYCLLKKRIADVTPFLVHGNKYTPAQLLGPDFWSALKTGESRMAVLAISCMANRGEITLAEAGRGTNGAASFTPANRNTGINI
jgi:hypothetical protein